MKKVTENVSTKLKNKPQRTKTIKTERLVQNSRMFYDYFKFILALGQKDNPEGKLIIKALGDSLAEWEDKFPRKTLKEWHKKFTNPTMI